MSYSSPQQRPRSPRPKREKESIALSRTCQGMPLIAHIINRAGERSRYLKVAEYPAWIMRKEGVVYCLWIPHNSPGTTYWQIFLPQQHRNLLTIYHLQETLADKRQRKCHSTHSHRQSNIRTFISTKRWVKFMPIKIILGWCKCNDMCMCACVVCWVKEDSEEVLLPTLFKDIKQCC